LENYLANKIFIIFTGDEKAEEDSLFWVWCSSPVYGTVLSRTTQRTVSLSDWVKNKIQKGLKRKKWRNQTKYLIKSQT